MSTGSGDPPCDRVNIVVPIHDPAADLTEIVKGLRAAGMTIRHVFEDMTVRKITGEVAPDDLAEVRCVPGIGAPRLEESFSIKPPGDARGSSGPGLA